MQANLQAIVDNVPDESRPAMNLLKASIEYEAETHLAAQKLADDIVFICRAEDINLKPVQEGSSGYLDSLWYTLIMFSRCIPPEHPWQDKMVKAVENLRLRDGVAPSMSPEEWHDLPGLSICMRETWDDLEVDVEEELNPGDFEKWKNQNSFAARLTSTEFSPWMNLPIWQLREALEEPPLEGPPQETRIWVACEWLIRCSDVIHNFLIEEEEPEYSSLATGELCDSSIPQLGPQRWEFWKRRLREVLSDAEKLKLGAEISERVQGALDRMESVQSTAVKDSEPTAAS